VGLADLQTTEVRQRVFLLTYGAYKAWQDFIVSALQVNNILFSIPLQALVELWESEAMKKPTLRVTKWLGDIPIEANCTACSDLSFKAKTASLCRFGKKPSSRRTHQS
jgi:hypothetical protein